MNKRGISNEYEMPQMLFYAFMVLLVSLVLLFGFGIGVKKDVDTVSLERTISEYRLFNSPDCFGYLDDGFFVKGVIDREKFNEDVLGNCLAYPDGKIQGIKLKLKDIEGNDLENIELNDKLVSQMFACEHSDDYECFNDRKYILYKENDQIKRGVLDFLIISEK
ncbi:MAG: hypothetical protein ABIH25_02720 [Candidatus Woesearchaeota archaeon]